MSENLLSNRLVGKNKAVIDDLPGLTRDRNYAEVISEDKEFILVDTGGFEPFRADNITSQIREQTQLAIEEADTIIFLVDGQAGLNPTDIEIARMLQITKKPLLCVVNKIDKPKQQRPCGRIFSAGC